MGWPIMNKIQLAPTHRSTHRTLSCGRVADGDPALATHLFFLALAGVAVGLFLAVLLHLTAWQPPPPARHTTGLRQPASRAARFLANLLASSAPAQVSPEEEYLRPLDALDEASYHLRRTVPMGDDTGTASTFTHYVHSNSWSEPVNLSTSQQVPSARPAVAVGPDRSVHAVWEENDRLFYRRRVGEQWTAPVSVASGRQPAAAIGADGTLYVVYVNTFMGQTNVFALRLQDGVWSLPRLVSRTRGESLWPAVAVDGQGTVHAVWADNTPGYPVIYHARLEEVWLYGPIPNARGTVPQLAYSSADNLLHVAWQSPAVGSEVHDIYHVQGVVHAWSLPENISASLTADAVNVALAVDANGGVHLAWQEMVGGRWQIKYAGGRQGHWTTPEPVSPAGANAEDPALAITHGNQINVVWRENNVIHFRRRSGNDDGWRPAKPLISNNGYLSDLALAADVVGRLHLAWSARSSVTEPDVFHSMGEASLPSQVFLPTTPVSR